MEMQFYKKKLLWQFLSPLCQHSGWTQTLYLGIMWQVFYHCATTTGHIKTNKSILINSRNMIKIDNILKLQTIYSCALYYKSFTILIYNRNDSTIIEPVL